MCGGIGSGPKSNTGGLLNRCAWLSRCGLFPAEKTERTSLHTRSSESETNNQKKVFHAGNL